MRFAVLAAALFIAPAAAHAVPLTGEAAQTCALMMMTSNPDSLAAMQQYNQCPIRELRRGMEHYVGVRIEPGLAADPIDVFGYAFYIDNRGTNAVFAPAGTADEWSAFLNTNGSQIDVTPACREVTIKNDDTCGNEVRTGYERVGRNITIQAGDAGRVLTYTCAPAQNSGQWLLAQSNGRPCSAGEVTPAQTAAIDPNDTFDRGVVVEAVQQGWAIQRNFQ